jgi:hypothetical protein
MSWDVPFLFSGVVALLFTLFAHTVVEAAMRTPKRSDFRVEFHTADNDGDSSPETRQAHRLKEQAAFDSVFNRHEFIKFNVGIATSTVAIVGAMALAPTSILGAAMSGGLLFGGLLVLLLNTCFRWGAIGLQARPFVVFAEFALVVFVAHRNQRLFAE